MLKAYTIHPNLGCNSQRSVCAQRNGPPGRSGKERPHDEQEIQTLYAKHLGTSSSDKWGLGKERPGPAGSPSTRSASKVKSPGPPSMEARGKRLRHKSPVARRRTEHSTIWAVAKNPRIHLLPCRRPRLSVFVGTQTRQEYTTIFWPKCKQEGTGQDKVGSHRKPLRTFSCCLASVKGF